MYISFYLLSMRVLVALLGPSGLDDFCQGIWSQDRMGERKVR